MGQTMYVIRHGETEFNAIGKFQGQGDSPLTQEGRDQMYHIGRMLKMEIENIHDWKIISSPLGRTVESTNILCDVLMYDKRNVIYDARLQEVSVGNWSGLYIEDIKAQWPRLLEGTNHYNWYFNSLEGERYADVEARISDFLDSVKDEPKLMIVAHGVTSRIIRGLYEQLHKDDALRLEASHETFFKLADGQVKRYTYEYEEF